MFFFLIFFFTVFNDEKYVFGRRKVGQIKEEEVKKKCALELEEEESLLLFGSRKGPMITWKTNFCFSVNCFTGL